jgi:truncated hemoglobin YjbI
MIDNREDRPMTWPDYWSHVSASFVGAAAFAGVLALVLWLAGIVQNKVIARREQREDEQARDEHNARIEAAGGEVADPFERTGPRPEPDERVEEGRLRVAVRRSVSTEAPEVAARRRQEQLDAAAVRRGEETTPIAVVRHEMARAVVIEPPIVEGVTLFAYLKHHAPQPSGLAWDAESRGVLANVTETMYKGIENDETLKPVFARARMDRTELRRHFVRALVDLTNKGLDEQAIAGLVEAHRHLGIRPEQFDAVIGHFVQALKTYLPVRVFETVLAQLGREGGAVAVLRERLVVGAGAA